MEIRAVMRQQPDGTWRATAAGDRPLEVSGPTRDTCLNTLRRAVEWDRVLEERMTLLVEVLPRLAGLSEAAEVMGWDRRRVVTYIDRGSFPEPLQALASGRVWILEDVEEFSADWHARHRARKRSR